MISEGDLYQFIISGSYEASERHKYWIRLYDARKGEQKFKKIYIDDFIPCHEKTKRPVFADPKGNELWVLLLEKAFAKFMGSYGRLDGGHTMWAFQAMTGNECIRFEYDNAVEQHAADDHKQRDEEEEEEEEEEMENKDDVNRHSVGRKGPCWRKWTLQYDTAKHPEHPREDVIL